MFSAVILILCLFIAVACFYGLYRNEVTYKFRGELLDMISANHTARLNELRTMSLEDFSAKNAEYIEKSDKAWEVLDEVSYDSMVYSLKPVRKTVSKEQLDTINWNWD